MPRARASTPAYSPCPQCGGMVLTGATPSGEQIALETGSRTFTILWQDRESQPRLAASRAYPEHRCHREERHDRQA